MNLKNAVILSFTLLLLLVGCDLFKTRDPQEPTQGNSGFKPPVTPDILLENFKLAIQEYNVDNYMRCFIDTAASSRTFTFTPSSNFQALIRSWNLEDERRYFQNLGKPNSGVPYLAFSNFKQENPTSNSTEFSMDYFLFYPHQRQDISQQVKGYMHLYLATDNQQRWMIYRWDDNKSTTDSTWSYLKYHLLY